MRHFSDILKTEPALQFTNREDRATNPMSAVPAHVLWCFSQKFAMTWKERAQ